MKIKQTKPFVPKDGAIGSEIIWTHLRTGQAPEVRTGIVIGQGPALGRGHKQELWVVPDSGSERDMYPGGVLVATRTKGMQDSFGAIPSMTEVPPGEVFSDDRLNAATGQIHLMNWRRSAAGQAAQAARQEREAA